jgi:predicted RNase H-like HicB family nuclease
MEIVDAIIERAADGTFTVYCVKEIFSGAGATIDAAKADMEKQMSFYKETAVKEGFRYPSFLDGKYEIHYAIDATSVMKYYVNTGVFSLAGMEKVTGINQKQLWAYMNGTKPRRAQVARIERGFRALNQDFNAIFAK